MVCWLNHDLEKTPLQESKQVVTKVISLVKHVTLLFGRFSSMFYKRDHRSRIQIGEWKYIIFFLISP